MAWEVFEKVRASLAAQGLVTQADLLTRLAEHLPSLRQPPLDHLVVDEAQDLSVAQLRFLAAFGGGRPDALFFAGDLGQRIFRLPFSWKALGVDVRGRSRTLRVNYRTSHQIRASADRLLGPEVADVDGNKEDRRGTPDGETIAIAGFTREVLMRTVEAPGGWRRLTGRAEWVNALAFSPDGQTLATGGQGGVVDLWDWQMQKRQLLASQAEGGVSGHLP